MKQFDITLKRVALETGLIIKSIPMRLYSIAVNKLTMLHNTSAHLGKSACPENQLTALYTIAGGTKNAFAGASHESKICSDANPGQIRYAFAHLNQMIAQTYIGDCVLTRYGLIRDMDLDEEYLRTLADLDDTKLEELDYITV